MVKYSCEKCGKEFTQKGHYTKHISKKNPCVFESKIKEMIEMVIVKRLNELIDNDDKHDKCNIEDQSKKAAGFIRKEGLDKFYTIPTCSKKCIDKICELYDITKWDLIVEPSAGNGSFLNQIPSNNKIGIDILPEHPNIIQQDFFEYLPPSIKKNILVIGNPPFGRISSLAIKFFNHSAKWANVIAFIIPRTFRKISVQNKLNNMFHLIYDEELPNNPCCFSPQMMVKCCFQIWERREKERLFIDLPTTHIDWEFLKLGPNDTNGQPTPPLTADFAMRAYGSNIGEIKTEELDKLRPKSWHWFKTNIDKKILIDRFNQLDYSNSLNTARQNSMGKAELVALYLDFLNSKL
jgi:hypothetical protein